MILSLKNISFTVNKTNIIKDISFSVQQGETLSIIGMNGAGKSTLLKIIAGIYKHTSGTLIKKYKTLSYVPQKLQIDKHLPILVSEYVNIYNPKTKQSYIDELFEAFGAASLYKKQLGSLSGGEFQKVLIISALLSQPEIILLDEPTAGIDIIGEENFYKNIAHIKNIFPNIAIILVSHNIHLVYKNSDRVICLHENNLCCHGTPSEVSQNKQVQNIFGDFVRPYEHHPHKHCED